MPRNRYKYKNTPKASPASDGPASPGLAGVASRTAQKVMDKIASGGEDYLMQNAERILIDSAKLVEEPEFIDLYFNKEKAAQATERWLKKYEARLKAAEKKSEDEFQMVFDEARIKIIDDLVSPAFRKQVDDRLHALANRVIPSNDARKIEMVLILGPMLRMKQIPWGLCGLIIEIYNRSLKQTLDEYQEQDEVVETVIEMLKEEGEEITDPSDILGSSQKLDEVGKKLFQKKPGLYERLQKQADDLIDSFEENLPKGQIPLNLFTEEEIQLPFHHFEEEIGKPLAEMQPSAELSDRLGKRIVQTINEMMTPERFQRLRKDAETTAKTWLRQREKWAIPLQLEVDLLKEDVREDNPFIVGVFFGQMRRTFKSKETAAQGKKKKR